MRHAAALLARPLCAFTLALSSFSTAAVEAADASAALDAVFETTEADAPGCNVGVIRDGNWIHNAGYGMANMELGVAPDGSQIHRMGSVSKQFTALAVQLLARMNTPNSQHDARGALYANGQFVGEQHGQLGFWHSGGWLGTSTYYGRFPGVRTSLLMMCNDASLDTGALVQQTLAIILGDKRES